MRIENATDALDAPTEDTTESITGLGLPEPDDDAEVKDEEQEQEPEAQAQPKQDISIRDAVLDALSEVANQMPAPLPQQPTLRQISKYEQEIEKLRAQGIPDQAIANFDALISAHTEGVLQHLSQANQRQAVQGYQAQLWQNLNEALEEAGGSVSTIKNAGRGARADLVDQAMRHIFQHPEFAGIKQTIDSFGMPSKNELKKVTAKVVDQYCKDNGITPKSQGIDLKSSKPDTSADTTVDVNSMSRKARAIYELTLKVTGNKNTALKRARTVM